MIFNCLFVDYNFKSELPNQKKNNNHVSVFAKPLIIIIAFYFFIVGLNEVKD